MKYIYILILGLMFLSIYPVYAQSNKFDINTVSLQHFDNNTMSLRFLGEGSHGMYDTFGYFVRDISKNQSFDSTNKPWVNHDENITYQTKSKKFGTGAIRLSSNSKGSLTSHYFENVEDIGDYLYNSGKLDPDFDFGSNKNWTVEFWVNITGGFLPAAGRNTSIIDWSGYKEDATTPIGAGIILTSNGNISVLNPATGNTVVSTNKGLVYNTWQSIALTKNGTSLQIWNNGRLNGTYSSATSINWTPGTTRYGAYDDAYTIDIGTKGNYGSLNPKNLTDNSYGFDGYIDEFRISNVSRYVVNYTPQTSEFVSPNNKSIQVAEVLGYPLNFNFTNTFIGIYGGSGYNVGDAIKVKYSIKNIYNTDTVLLSISNMTLGTSIYSLSRNTTLPSCWTSMDNPYYNTYYGSEPELQNNRTYLYDDNITRGASAFYQNNAPPITTLTPFIDAVFSFDDVGYSNVNFGSLPDKTVSGDIVDYQHTAFLYNNTYGISLLNYSQSSSTIPIIEDYSTGLSLSLISIEEVLEGWEDASANVGDIVNMSIYVGDIFTINGYNFNIAYNKTAVRIKTIYNNGEILSVSESGSSYLDNMNMDAYYDNTLGVAELRFNRPIVPGFSIPFEFAALTEGTPILLKTCTISFEILTPASTLKDGYTTIALNGANYTAGNPITGMKEYVSPTAYTIRPYTYIHEFAGIISGDIDISDELLLSEFEFININTGANIPTGVTATYSARSADPPSPQTIINGETLSVVHKGGLFNISTAADGYFTNTQSLLIGSSSKHTIYLTPLTGPISQTWYSPHQVSIKIIDGNRQPVLNARVTAVALESSLPGGLSGAAVSLQNAFGINSGEAAKMVDSAIYMNGTTGSDGRITFMMHGSLKYNISITDAYNNTYLKSLYPLDNYYMLSIYSGQYTSPQNVASTYESISNATLTFSEPNQSYMTMGIDYTDTSGLTDTLYFFVQNKNNNTIMYSSTTPVSGTQRVLRNYTTKNNRGEPWIWWYDAHRSV